MSVIVDRLGNRRTRRPSALFLGLTSGLSHVISAVELTPFWAESRGSYKQGSTGLDFVELSGQFAVH